MPSTLTTPAVPFGVVDSMVSATVGSWTSVARAGLDYWSGALARRATPFDLGQDLLTWTRQMNDRERPRWANEHTVAREWPIARLRDYSTADADPTMVATILLPPQAGHDSSIVDYSPTQSQILTARDNGCHRVLSMDWVGATQETKDTSIEDYMQVLREAVEHVGGRANLVGDCQGGWLATIFTALHPEMVNSLAIAGAPIDFHAGEPLIHDWVQLLTPGEDMTFYRSVVDANDGLLPGDFLLHGFMALQPDQELDRQLQLLAHLHDPAHVERYHRFENWFQWTQALPGEFYLWVVEHLFAGNELIKGELVVEGRTVRLSDISCPLFLMAGETDHITPAPQVWALAEHASTPEDQVGRQSSTGGHLGLFMGHESLERHWSIIFAEMAALSSPGADVPQELTDEPTGHGEFVVDVVPAPTPKVRARRSTTRKAAAATRAASKRTPRTAATAPATPAEKPAASAEKPAPAAEKPASAAEKPAEKPAPRKTTPRKAAPRKTATAQDSTGTGPDAGTPKA